MLAGVDAEFPAGSVTAIVGPNGAGKTTLMRAAMGLLPIHAGEVLLDQEPVAGIPRAQRPRRLVFIPQRSEVAFAYTVREVVAMGRLAAGEGAPEADESIWRALTVVELADRANDRIGELSAGQQQRATLARALVQLEVAIGPHGLHDGRPGATPPRTLALLADEPVSAMDLRHAVQTLALLKSAAARGIAVAVILHDLTLASRIADRILVLTGAGTIAAAGPASQVLTPSTLGPVLGLELVTATVPGGGLLVGPASTH